MATKKRAQPRGGAATAFRPMVLDAAELRRRMRSLAAVRDFEAAAALARSQARLYPADFEFLTAFAICLTYSSQFTEASAILIGLYHLWPSHVAASNSLFWPLMRALVATSPALAVQIVEECVSAGTMTPQQGYRWIRYVGQFIGDFGMVRDASLRILPSWAEAFPEIPEVHREDGTVRFPAMSPTLPCYAGGSIDGQTLVVYDGSGFGDCFFSVRWLPAIKAISNARRIVFVVRPELAEFARTFALDAEIAVRGDDEYVPDGPATFTLLVALTTIIAPTCDDFWRGPYIAAPSRLTATWRQRLEATCGTALFKAGIVWQAGHVGVEALGWRNLNSIDLAPLADIEGVAIVSLQKGRSESDYTDIPGAVSFASETSSFEDTAAIIANLDLVITVDCGVANLAGAIGAPTWVMLEPLHDGRYGLGATPDFYPTLRCFRQRVRGNWTDAIGEVAAALRKLVASTNTTSRANPLYCDKVP